MHSFNKSILELAQIAPNGTDSIISYIESHSSTYYYSVTVYKIKFSILAYRCCYCHYWNPARKQRPTAPKLEASTLRPQTSTETSSSDEGIVNVTLFNIE